jgi:UDP-N-acetylmuramyl pentapeptide phosphotransferase/UDP-N-acetylglucosamine-1-phosphate transferase
MESSSGGIIVILITEFLTVFFLLTGYMIHFKRRLDYLRGYDPTRVSDRAGLARLTGGVLLFLGVYAAITLFVELIFPDFGVLSFILLLGIIPVTGVITAWKSRRFERS